MIRSDLQIETQSGGRPWVARVLAGLAVVAFFLLVHNYGINLLPYHRQVLSPDLIRSETEKPSFAYAYPFKAGGVPDRVRDMRSRLILSEDGKRHTQRSANLDGIASAGGDCYTQLPDRVVFATFDNTDPRHNGRIYAIAWPMWYSPEAGRASAVVLALSLGGLGWMRRRRPPSAAHPAAGKPGRWQVWAAGLVFMAGLYGSTGTLAPYAVTFYPHIDPATGHAYNQDHIHFRVMFDFVDGQPREVWEKALLLRRILYPVLAWPAMKLGGFEAGGVVTNLVISLAAFIGTVFWLRKRTGERAAVMAAWLMATYPGFPYWVGMPYQYACIAPGALLLAIALAEIADSPGRGHTLRWAFLMGAVYLAYDFAPVFLPATVGLLLWRRRWLDTGLAAVAGVLPLVCWLLLLRFGFGQSLENSNTGVYRAVVDAFLGIKDWGAWLAGLPRVWDHAVAIFFGANFVFLPALFLGLLCLNGLTRRVRLADSEIALLGATGLLFLGINLGADFGGSWNMSGTWVARVYQQVFPAMIFFVARWWQERPVLPRAGTVVLMAGLSLATVGNLLVVFGPLTRDYLGVSGAVFYRFYSHGDGSWSAVYENNLRRLPRQTLGFGQPQPGSQPGGTR